MGDGLWLLQVLHWDALRETPQKVRDLLSLANASMTATESDPNLSAEGRRAKLKEIARPIQAELTKLRERQPLCGGGLRSSMTR